MRETDMTDLVSVASLCNVDRVHSSMVENVELEPATTKLHYNLSEYG